ncbi:hypothetical protein ABZ924_30115 [Streptomyces sp. NPDC046876]|uniref:hypothetical protein n=1 Tax=Streptomyces sp. NPDC046876 TaxID=3155616 RepID=UPI0033CEAA19
MKARAITSLALPAALATAGLLSTAEAAYASLGPNTTVSAKYGQQIQPLGDVTLTPGAEHPCPPFANVTITDYGHCCTPVGNITIPDYGHCCTPVGNITIPDYGHCREHDHDEHGPHRPDHRPDHWSDYGSLERQS